MTNHEKHILLWDELARTGRKNKYLTFSGLFPEESAIMSCWACEECDADCDVCPIDWGEHLYCSDDEWDGLYDLWSSAKTKNKRKLLAAQIRDLPWRTK